ncbi:MAG: AraC family transcriptional regulator, partial [Lawsonibacter sp.]
FRSLEELGGWLGSRCLKLREALGRQRTDSAWKTVEKAKDFIAEHYADSELSVETLCSHLHLSSTYFSTLFKRETGMGFTAYVTEVRMERAARLLQDTDEKTYLIAEQTGYPDPNYFSYVFRRRFGVTPSKFRAGGGA